MIRIRSFRIVLDSTDMTRVSVSLPMSSTQTPVLYLEGATRNSAHCESGLNPMRGNVLGTLCLEDASVKLLARSRPSLTLLIVVEVGLPRWCFARSLSDVPG